ncbi:MAG: hypothetical protein Q9216_006157 [Gyalolechia sp. 2 TL-2023]
MYYVAAVLPFIGLCFASPALDDPTSTKSGNLPSGIPTQYLPPAGLQAVSSDDPQIPGELKLPLRPQNVYWLRPRIRYDFSFNRPKGGQLVMSLSTTIYYAWIDTANQPIPRRISLRKEPFPDFVYTVTPSLRMGTVFTAFKAGIAYCWIVQSVLNLPAWPSVIHAEISEKHEGLAGTLEIENSPQATTITNPAGPGKEAEQLEKMLFANESYSSITQPVLSPNSKGPALAVSSSFERRWFTCISGTLLFIIAKGPLGSVTDVLTPPPDPNPVTYQFNCAPGRSNHDQVDIQLFPTAGQDQARLTWNVLAKSLLLLGTRVAENEDGWELAQTVLTDEGVPAASLKIRVANEAEAS